MRFLYKLGIHLAQSAGCWFPNAFCWFVLIDEHQQTRPRFPLPWTFHPDFARTSIPNCTTASNSRDSITGWLASSLSKVATTWEIVCKKMWTIWPSNLAPLGRSWVQMRRKPQRNWDVRPREKLNGKKVWGYTKILDSSSVLIGFCLHLEGQELSHLYCILVISCGSCARFRLSICLLRYIISTDMLEEMLSNTGIYTILNHFPNLRLPSIQHVDLRICCDHCWSLIHTSDCP